MTDKEIKDKLLEHLGHIIENGSITIDKDVNDNLNVSFTVNTNSASVGISIPFDTK